MTEPGPTPYGWHTLLATYARCPKEYEYEVVLGIRPPDPPNLSALYVGILFHAGRAAHFRNQDVEVEVRLAAKALPNQTEAGDAMPRALALVHEYRNWWAASTQPTVIGVEYELGPVKLWPKAALPSSARLDLVARYHQYGNGLWWSEAKTTSAEPASVIAEYRLHPQILYGMCVWDAAPQGRAIHGPLAGVVLDIVRKGYGGARPTFTRVPLTVTETAKKWFRTWVRRALYERNRIVMRKQHGRRNPLACTRFHGRMRTECPYLPLCARGKAGAVGFTLLDGTPIAEDPRQPWK